MAVGREHSAVQEHPAVVLEQLAAQGAFVAVEAFASDRDYFALEASVVQEVAFVVQP